jgi:predicted aspartyl protease
MYTYDYDFSFSPSMPVVDVALMPIARNREPVRITAMIDSGADGTLVPLSQLRAIKAHRAGQVILRTVTGAPTVVDIYEVALQVGPHLFSYVRVAADKHNTLIVLGRDILNHLVITLNGLASATELLE